MMLSELADYICTKVGQKDEESAEACRLFLRRRYRMIWDYALWKETLFVTGPDSANGAYSTFTMPLSVEQVLSMRYRDQWIGPLDQTAVMALHPGLYDAKGGSNAGFVFLSPGCTRQELSDGADLCLYRYDPADADVVVSISGEFQYSTNPFTVQAPLSQFYTELSLGSRVTNITTLCVSRQPNSGVELQSSSGQSLIEVVGSTGLSQTPRVRVRILDAAMENSMPQFLAKRRPNELLAETSGPTLRNCENALLAFGQADMLERQRQYAKAQVKVQEGYAQLQIMIDLERNQSANEQRIVPIGMDGSVGGGWAEKGVW